MNNLAYIEWLLERLVWVMSPTNKDFPDFRNDVLKEQYDASRITSPAEIHGDMRAQPEARPGEMPGHDKTADARLRLDPKEGVANSFTKKKDDNKWQSLTPTPHSDKAADLPPLKPAPKQAELQILPQWLRR